ncbi:hypothetical protein BGW36DRAFT_10565 [Talaromyces proteolyticus]|uniref:RING-type domain-containing protein n=1 Tax=Talaromyces proteolyticus TaxID=1131652 RepID=A0AAD4Q629_9EURO|nr:uncharacterized protein BGW36DRAFT_10565 [Talaromyces proteolyticus]KAH8705266.1 hypothetical protein BGW36DRAFT_10565 [Talaromyces proteolyticus]
MADTCIVCLNDLGAGASSPSPVLVPSPPRLDNHDNDDGEDNTQPSTLASLPADRSSRRIARLVPCLHMFHDDCLKPWVERANSCPALPSPFTPCRTKSKRPNWTPS